MTKKELKNLIATNSNITIVLEDEWRLVKNTNSMLGETIHINNIDDVQKWAEFSNIDDAAKYFMAKVSYMKRRLKRNISININIK